MHTRIFTLLGAVGAAAALAGCGAHETATTSETSRMRAELGVDKVVRRDVVGYDLLPGKVYTPASAEAVVYAPFTAPVERVLATVGQRVGRGSVIIELSLPDHEANYEQARASVKAAEAAHASALAQYSTPVREAERALRDARATERTIRAQTDPNGDASALVQARAAREAAEQAVQQTRAQRRIDMLPYVQQLEAARTALRAAQEGKSQSTVNAPISGTIVEMNARPGETVGTSAREVLARLVDLDAVQVRAIVPPASVDRVKPETPVVVLLEGMPEKPLDGVVTSVKPLPAESGVVRHEAVVRINDADGAIRPNTRVRAIGVRIGVARNALAVPSDAISRGEDGKPVVRVLRGSEWMSVVVEPGLSDGFYTAVKGSLREGETVRVPVSDD